MTWRSCVRSTAARTITCRALRDADRPDQPGLPERRLVGHLRSRLGVVEPAGVRRDDRCPRRAPWGTQRLGRRLHAGGVPGDGVSLDRRSHRRSQAAGGDDRRRSARASRCAGQAERARHAEVSRATASWRRAFPRTSWRIACRVARQRPSISPANRKRRKNFTGSTTRSPSRSASSACWRAGWSSAAFASCRSFHGGVGNQNVDTWDAHGDIKSTTTRSTRPRSTSRSTGLLTDLKARGLLDSTLVIWHWRVRPHADLAARRRPRSQSGHPDRAGCSAPASRAAR